MKADLHNHSIYSDGLYNIDELLKIAQDHHIDVMALTDHDSVYGCDTFLKKASIYHIKPILGLELSTVCNNESVHILGFFKNNIIPSSMYEFSDMIKQRRYKRAIDMLNKIKDIYGVNIDFSMLEGRDIITRGNMFQIILASNPNISKQEASFMISHDSKAYIEVAYFNTLDGIKFLHENNCIAIYAHPTLNKKQTIKVVCNCGIDGIEFRYPSNKDGEEEYFKKLAFKYNLFLSAGSDFHGDVKHAMIGTSTIDEDLYKIIERRLYDDN